MNFAMFFGQNNKGDTMKNKLFIDMAESFVQKDLIKKDEKTKNGIVTSYFEVNEGNKKRLKRDAGDYFTITYNNEILEKYPNNLKKEIIKILKYFKQEITNYGTTLIIGLGNSSISCDSLGPKTTNKIIATNHYVDFLTIPKVALFVPEVIGKTGISSFELIKMLVNSIKPSSIIVIDSLSTNNNRRLNNCIEISNTGIIPGSAIMTNKKISSKTFNIPVISIGAPLVIEVGKKIYTSTDIDQKVSSISDVIARFF